MPTPESLLADAARLTVADRRQLIDALWETLPVAAFAPLSDEWSEEIRRRSAEYDAGNATTTPWEKVKSDAWRRAGLSVRDTH